MHPTPSKRAHTLHFIHISISSLFCGYSYIHNTLFNIEELNIRKKKNTIISNTRDGTGDDVDVYFISTKSYRISELGCHTPCQCSTVIRVVDFTAIIERKFPTVGKKFITWGVSNSSSIAVIDRSDT